MKHFSSSSHLSFSQKLLFALLILASLSLSSCLVTTQVTELNKPEQSVQLYTETPPPSQCYEEIIHLELTGSIFTPRKKLKEQLIEEANKYHCNAVMHTKFKTSFIWPQVLGTGIRYQK